MDCAGSVAFWDFWLSPIAGLGRYENENQTDNPMTQLLAATPPPVLRHGPLLVHRTLSFLPLPFVPPAPHPLTHPSLPPELFTTHEWSDSLIAPAIFFRTRIGAWLAYRLGKRRRRRGRVTSRAFIRYSSRLILSLVFVCLETECRANEHESQPPRQRLSHRLSSCAVSPQKYNKHLYFTAVSRSSSAASCLQSDALHHCHHMVRPPPSLRGTCVSAICKSSLNSEGVFSFTANSLSFDCCK